jgi:hypothetical protein
MKSLTALLIFVVVAAAQTAKDVTEFTIFKRSEPVKILPGIEIALKTADVAKQRYGIVLSIDGHKLERKDLDIRVPFYFVVGANMEPHELVVLKVGADQIVGRLVSPK